MLKPTQDGGVPQHTPANPNKFEFDAEVTKIFDNMAERSIPMYAEAHRLHASLIAAAASTRTDTVRVLDIGASTGQFLTQLLGATKPYGQQTPSRLELHAMDNSKPMVAELRKRMPSVNVMCCDITSVDFTLIENYYDVISLFYVLQFLPKTSRKHVISQAVKALRPNGILIIGQKFNNQIANTLKMNEYHKFRMSNGYTVDEIHTKSQALADTMQLTDYDSVVNELVQCGIDPTNIEETTRWLQFSTLMAVKG